MRGAPAEEVLEYPHGRAWIVERRGAHTDRGRARQQHLDRVDACRDAPGADDRHARMCAGDVVHGSEGDRLDRRTGQAASARAERGPAPLGVDDEAEQRVDERETGCARSQRGRGDLAQVGDVRRELHEHGKIEIGLVHGLCRRARRRRGVGEHRRAVLEVRAADVDLDGDKLVACRAEQLGRSPELLDRTSPDRRDDARAGGAERREIVVDPVLDARSLQADGVEHPRGRHMQARRRVAGPLVGREGLRRDRAEASRIAVTGELVAVAEGSGGGDDRVGQLERSELHASVDPGEVRASAPTGHHTSSRSWWSRWYSCNDRTCGSLVAHSASPDAAATAAAPFVRHDTRWAVAVRRMWSPSARGPRPRGVLTTRSTFPDEIMSTASMPASSPSLATTASTGMPSASSAAAVPAVATSENPSSASRRAATRPAGLSRSAKERKTVPVSGSRLPAAAWLFVNASPKDRSTPITSPVERISGPSTVSTSGNRSNGSTASLTATWAPVPRPGTGNPSAFSSANVAPSMTRAASFASGAFVALLTNGTVRLARGFASRTKTSPSFTAYCPLRSPRTSSADASARVWASIVTSTGVGRVVGGMTHAESPECTPASSMCSITPPMTTSPAASRSASTSTSVASSRNRSTSAGRVALSPPSPPTLPVPATPPTAARSPPSRPRLPVPASSAMAASSPSPS